MIEVVLEAHARANVARPLNRIQAFYRRGIDDGRSGAPKVVHRFHENRDNFRIGRLALIGLPQHADHGAVESVGIEGRGVIRMRMIARRGGDRIVRVIASDHLKDGGGILHGACDGTSDVGEQGERDHAGAAGESHGGANADQSLMRRGTADGVPGIAAQSHQAEARRDGRRRSTARARRDAIERVRIFRVAGQNRADGLIGTEGPLGHIGFRQHDGAGFFDALDQKRVFVRNISGHGERAAGGLQSSGLEVIFHDHRHAVQRTGQAGLGKAAVQFGSFLFGVGIDQDDGIDRRAVLIVSRDPAEIIANQRAAGKMAGLHGIVDLRDGGLLDFEGVACLSGEKGRRK